jgi:hypothetical protein
MQAAPVSDKMARMMRHVLPAGLILALAACASTAMRWEKPGTPDPAKDQAECQAEAREEAARELPYGDGPPLYGFHSDVSMLQWKQAIDNERYYVERDLTKACMHDRGFEQMPIPRSSS